MSIVLMATHAILKMWKQNPSASIAEIGVWSHRCRQRFIDRLVDSGNRDVYGSPAEIAKPYIENSERISAKLTELGFGKTAIVGVLDRIKVLSDSPTWSDWASNYRGH
jgi:hypothetical protein